MPGVQTSAPLPKASALFNLIDGVARSPAPVEAKPDRGAAGGVIRSQRGTEYGEGEAVMGEILSDAGMDLLFRKARTHRIWQDGGIGDALLAALYELAKMGPTSGNCNPMRVVFVKSREAKERLKPFLDKGNVEKTMTAPVTAIIAYDTKFYDLLPTLSPNSDARGLYVNDPEYAAITTFRNGSLQGAYLIVAARAVGLDCGPMSGFDNAKLDKEFFPDGRFKSNFLCNLGHGDPAALKPRNPRLSFDEACNIV